MLSIQNDKYHEPYALKVFLIIMLKMIYPIIEKQVHEIFLEALDEIDDDDTHKYDGR